MREEKDNTAAQGDPNPILATTPHVPRKEHEIDVKQDASKQRVMDSHLNSADSDSGTGSKNRSRQK